MLVRQPWPGDEGVTKSIESAPMQGAVAFRCSWCRRASWRRADVFPRHAGTRRLHDLPNALSRESDNRCDARECFAGVVALDERALSVRVICDTLRVGQCGPTNTALPRCLSLSLSSRAARE